MSHATTASSNMKVAMCHRWMINENMRAFLALCGLPGIGQLAWQAALSRDLPLLVNLTVLVTLVTLLANSGPM